MSFSSLRRPMTTMASLSSSSFAPRFPFSSLSSQSLNDKSFHLSQSTSSAVSFSSPSTRSFSTHFSSSSSRSQQDKREGKRNGDEEEEEETEDKERGDDKHRGKMNLNSFAESSRRFGNILASLTAIGAVIVAADVIHGNQMVYAAPAAAAPSPSSSTVDYQAVRNAIAALLDADGYDDGSRGPLFIRLAWHASGTYSKVDGTGGSDGGKIRFSPEKDWGANKGLQVARDVLEPIYKANKGLSHADLYTLAGVVAVEEMGGPKINWRSGRSDAADGKSSPPDGRLPDASQGADHIRNIFYRMGLNDSEIVALSGAHSLGRCHTDRSGFEGPWTRAPTTFSNEYFRLLLEEKWTLRKWSGPAQYENKDKDLMMLPTDLALIEDKKFKPIVEKYAKDSAAFEKDFASAFGKLLELGWKMDTPKK